MAHNILFKAYDTEDINKVIQLLQNGSNPNVRGRIGQTLLHRTCMNNDIICVRELLNFNADLDVQDIYGYTALHYACLYGRLEIAKILIQAGANLNIVTTLERSSLDGNCYREFTPLNIACNNVGNLAIIQILIHSGALVAIPNSRQETPLHTSCLRGEVEYVRELLNTDINPNIQNYEGRTSLHLAVINRHSPIVKLLLEHKVAFDTPDNYGITPLVDSFYWRSWDCTMELLNVVTETNINKLYRDPLLHIACIENQPVIVSKLLKLGIDTNIRNHKGETSLDICKKHNYHDLIKLIEEYDYFPMIKNALD